MARIFHGISGRSSRPAANRSFRCLQPDSCRNTRGVNEVKASLLLQTSKVTGSRHQFSDRIDPKRGNQASHGTYV